MKQMKNIFIGIQTLCMLLLLAACTSEDVNNNADSQTEEDGIAFSSVVIASRQATRADGTILNLGETTLSEDAEVGIFGAYTGQNTWSSLVTLSKKVSPTTDETALLEKYYMANLLFNSKATVGADGKTLTYSPLRFWPNNVLTSGDEAGQHEYATFWAYYPYNETSSVGTYGIAITESSMGAKKGMGRVKFTMHTDAADQNDFLISAPVTDCNRDKYPLLRTDNTPTYDPKPVQFRLYHMLAQVRFYAIVAGMDKMVYEKVGDKDKVAEETWFDSWDVNGTITDPWGNVYTKKEDNAVERTTQKDAFPSEFAANLTKAEFVALGLKVPDESKCERWERTSDWDVSHSHRLANITYTLELNNIHTSATFFPSYDGEGKNATIDYETASALSSVTINDYVINPYWFTFQDGKRVRLNDNYMFGYYEDTPVKKQLNATTTMTGYDDVDGVNWTGTSDPLKYLEGKTDAEKEKLQGKGSHASDHYNYYPGNILLVVPQSLTDEDVPHVVIKASGATTKNGVPGTATAKVTINMLKMGISWESGYIYCYAILDDLRPGDDKVRGPESIVPSFNSNWYTDQW